MLASKAQAKARIKAFLLKWGLSPSPEEENAVQIVRQEVSSKKELDTQKSESESRGFTVSVRVQPYDPEKPEVFSAVILADKIMPESDKTSPQETDAQDRKRRERTTDRWLKASWWLIIILALLFYFLLVDILIPTFVRMVSSK